MNEKYSYRLLRDLLAHHDPIFGELKRASSQAQRQATEATAAKDRGRQRNTSITTDESGRRLAEEERRQAIKDRSRAASPAPGDRRSIRRERSPHRLSGGPDTRFPVAVKAPLPSPVAAASAGSPTSGGRARTQSLEVPGSQDNSPVGVVAPTPAAPSADHAAQARPNGAPAAAANLGAYSAVAPAAAGADIGDGTVRHDSFGRSAVRVPRKEPGSGPRQSLYGSSRASAGSLKDIVAQQQQQQPDHRGVELVDRPMDD